MKRFAIFLSFIVLISICTLTAQTRTVIFADTLGNSQTKVGLLEVTPDLDSVVVSLYCYGAMDADSLDIKFGYSETVKYKNNTNKIDYFASSSATYSKTLTVSLTNVQESYTANVTTIPASALKGYNIIKASLIAASSGNSGASKQKAVLVATYYK